MVWRERVRLPERMDHPDLAPSLHRQALRGLARLNAVSGIARTVAREILGFATEHSRSSISWLDVACGGGDILVQVAQRLRQSGLDVRCSGCDIHPTAIATSLDRARRHRFDNIDVFQHDILSADLPRSYDIVTSTLFLHHLSDSEATAVLRRMRDAARGMVLIDDLRRTRRGYWLAVIACRALTRSPIVHYDGPVSVRAAFTGAEIERLATAAGWKDRRLRYHWPERLLLTCKVRP